MPSKTVAANFYSGDRNFYQTLEQAVTMLREPEQVLVKPMETPEDNP